MENANRLDAYLALLKVRQKANLRNVYLAGGMFLLAMLSTTGTLFLTEWNARSLWIMGVFVVLFTVNFVMAWARHQITNEKIELVNNLQVRG